ncbi:hypothetical protein ACJJTC_007371 [Scirpophaga incertulas]
MRKLMIYAQPDDPRSITFADLAKILDDYIDPVPGPYALQHRFISRLQNKDETIHVYAATLRKLTTNCDFQCLNCQKSIVDNFLCLQFIRGLRDSDIRTKLLQNKKIETFTEIIQTTTVLQMAHAHSSAHHSLSQHDLPIATDQRQRNKKPTSTPIYTKLRQLQGKCFRCGIEDHMANECGIINQTCYKCQKKGHLAKVYLH